MTEEATPPASEAEVTAETEVVEPVATTETTTQTTAELLNSDAFVDRVADRVFDKVKVFTTDLITASQSAVEIAQQMVPIEGATEAPPVEEPPMPDQAPERRHRMFAQPFKRRDN